MLAHVNRSSRPTSSISATISEAYCARSPENPRAKGSTTSVLAVIEARADASIADGQTLETLTVGPLQQCLCALALVGRHAPDHAEPRDLLIEPRSPEIHGGVGAGFVAIADRKLLRDRHPEIDLLIGPAADEFVGRDANDGRDDAAVHHQRLSEGGV